MPTSPALPYLPNQAPPPLTTREFYVLLALHAGESHTYQLKSRIFNISLGSINIAAATLYPIMMRFAEDGWIDEAPARPTNATSTLRRHYSLSAVGIIRLQEELLRLRHAVKIGEHTGLLNIHTPLDIQRLMLDHDEG